MEGCAPPQPREDLGARCKLPNLTLGLGQSPCRKWILVHFELELIHVLRKKIFWTLLRCTKLPEFENARIDHLKGPFSQSTFYLYLNLDVQKFSAMCGVLQVVP